MFRIWYYIEKGGAAMNFTELINQLRKERGLSVDELARRSGVPKGTLSKLTAGISTNPTI
ncbi:MAG: helix-turn-helix transcriptional regulator, partial [Ruminococcus sp.]|nr:helix-turn-helix transcriptional regulator [Ruminococcus sp.]